MPPSRRAGKSAYVEKFVHEYSEQQLGYCINCRLCHQEGRQWSTRRLAHRLWPKRDVHDSWPEVMNLWTIHMGIHHPDAEQPEWVIVGELDPRIETAEFSFFKHDAEHRDWLESIGVDPDRARNHEREVNRLRKQAEKLGHVISLPAAKIPKVSSASQGWVCTCGASGHAEPTYSARAQNDQAREHLRSVLVDQTSEV